MKNSFCYKCKLHNSCLHPCLPNLQTAEKCNILIIGDYTNSTDDKEGRIWSHSDQKMFLQYIHALNETYAITNVVRCTPYKFELRKVRGKEEPQEVRLPAKPTPSHKKNCLPRLYQYIDQMKPKVIITVGSYATNTLLNLGISIDKARGVYYYHPEFNAYVVPMLDCDMYSTDNIHLQFLKSDLKMVKEILNTRGIRKVCSKPRSLKDPIEIKNYLLSLFDATYVAYDLETTGLNPRKDRITDISFCSKPGEGVHIKWEYILPHLDLFKQLMLLDKVKWVGQNIKFDRTHLMHNHIKTALPYIDTMLGYHTLTMMHESGGGGGGGSSGMYTLERMAQIFTHEGDYKSILQQWGGIGKYQKNIDESGDEVVEEKPTKTEVAKKTIAEKKQEIKKKEPKEVKKKVVSRLPLEPEFSMFNISEELENNSNIEESDFIKDYLKKYEWQKGNELIHFLMNRTANKGPKVPKSPKDKIARESSKKQDYSFEIDDEEEALLTSYVDFPAQIRAKKLEELKLTPLEYYSALDADVTLQIGLKLEPLLKQQYEFIFWDLIMPLNNAIMVMEATGTLLDVPYVNTMIESHKIKQAEEAKAIYAFVGKEFNIDSNDELSEVIYKDLKIPPNPKFMTKGGKSGVKKPSVDVGAIEFFASQKGYEPLKHVLDYRSYGKEISTYFEGFTKLVDPVSGRIHGSFLQTTTATGRLSCIAEGTKISCVGDDKNIEDVKVGDLVYCYDDDGKLKISEVLNVFDNGVRECIRLHWQSSGNGKTGELICTPDHLIKTKYKGWVQAKDLKRYDKVYHMKKSIARNEYNITIYGTHSFMEEEHTIIKREYFKADNKLHIHHKDENRLNNNISNLQIMTPLDHATYHGNKAHKEGKINYAHLKYAKQTHFVGWKNNCCIRVNKESLIQMIHDARGKYTKVPMDFSTFVMKCKVHGVDYKAIADEYSRTGLHITKEVLLAAIQKRQDYIDSHQHLKDPLWQLQYDLKITPLKLRRLLKYYDISLNHMILKVHEESPKHVYDLEIKDYHNFIANEICVHNCTAPNLQNLPRADYVRNMIIPSPGCKLVGADLSQAELRILSMVANDTAMQAGFNSGFDFHVYTASSMFGVPLAEFDHENNKKHKELRGAAKTINFGIAYGRKAPSIAQQVGCSIEEAEEFMSKFFKSYPHVKQWIGDTIETARRTGYVDTVHGRRRYLPYINSSDQLSRNHAENQAINTPIQGTASDCACFGLIRVTDYVLSNGFKARPVMIIHDEIQMDTPDDEVAHFAEKLPFFMTNNIPLITVPLVSDATILERWEKG